MAIAKAKPTVKKIKPNLPKVEPTEYEGIITDDKYTPLTSTISYIEGSSYTVDYYSQVVAKHNDLKELDNGQSSVYQQYSKIAKFELMVTSPLSSTEDSETSTTIVTGEANVYPPLVPNVGDMFVADIGDGFDGIFTVKEVSRKNFSRDSVFSIGYVLVVNITKDSDRYRDLESKVIKTVYFYKDFLLANQNPNIVSEDYKNIANLNILYNEICQYFFNAFFNTEYNTLIIPGQKFAAYDSLVVEFIMKIVSTFDANEIRSTRVLNLDKDPNLGQDTLWTALINRNIDILRHANKKMGLVTYRLFSGNPMLNGFRFSGIQYTTYPLVPDQSLRSSANYNEVIMNPFYTEGFIYVDYPETVLKYVSYENLKEVPTTTGDLTQILSDLYIDGNVATPIIKDVLVDDYYVFSSAFYVGDKPLSLLEIITMDYLKGHAVNPTRLYSVVKNFRQWGRLEQFYYLPIIILLIKAAIG